MNWLRFILVFIVCAVWFGCTNQQTADVTIAMATAPFVDRTEKEINDWFDNRTIIDDREIVSTTTNGEPSVLLIHEGPKLKVNGIDYPGVMCITQTNEAPGEEPYKYAALVGIRVLDNPNLFECGEIDLSETSCDGDQKLVNVTLMDFHDKATLEKAFRNAVDQWIKDDIVNTLKSTTNRDGFPDSAAEPRRSAKVRGVLYNVIEDKGIAVRTIGFIAQ